MNSHENIISSNNISISISIFPELPDGEIETFADADVWTDDAVETADGVKTPDGKLLVWGKNVVYTRTLSLAPTSKIQKYIERAVMKVNRKGTQYATPSNITVVVRDNISGCCDTYLGGFIKSTQVGMSVGQERLNNRETVFCFSEVVINAI